MQCISRSISTCFVKHPAGSGFTHGDTVFRKKKKALKIAMLLSYNLLPLASPSHDHVPLCFYIATKLRIVGLKWPNAKAILARKEKSKTIYQFLSSKSWTFGLFGNEKLGSDSKKLYVAAVWTLDPPRSIQRSQTNIKINQRVPQFDLES